MKTLLIICFVVISFNYGFSEELCLKEAWKAYNTKDWRMAIENAESCIIQFAPRAFLIQSELVKKSYKIPCVYTVPNDCSAQQKQEIFEHGLLNDVCTCYWIVGMSKLYLGEKEAAKIAFRKAVELTFGLCSNKDGNSFWSPSEEASLQLKILN